MTLLHPLRVFVLDDEPLVVPQLAADTTHIGDLALSRLLAINAADYPWLVLVPRRGGVVELADLGSDAFPLTAEIGVVSLALKELTHCDKINIAAIGNVVPQLHIHIVARRKTDPLWPKPVFGVTPLPRADAAKFERFVEKVRKKLAAATANVDGTISNVSVSGKVSCGPDTSACAAVVGQLVILLDQPDPNFNIVEP